MWIFPGAQTPISLKQAKVHHTYVGRLERGESGVTVDAGGDLGGPGRQLTGVLQALQSGGEAEDAEEAGLGKRFRYASNLGDPLHNLTYVPPSEALLFHKVGLGGVQGSV